MNDSNKLDRINYSHSYPRPMLAEVVIDVLGDATGVQEDFGADAPPGSRAIEVGSIKLLDADLSYALRTFGRPDRILPCDCERSTQPALSWTLFRMADPMMQQKLSRDVLAARVKGKKARPSFNSGRLAKLLAGNKTPEEILEELFLATLGRFPREAEKKHFDEYRSARKSSRPAESKDREESCSDALWALINTREFILNH
jgi:hypothetical protein